jgi:hypothetical protein
MSVSRNVYVSGRRHVYAEGSEGAKTNLYSRTLAPDLEEIREKLDGSLTPDLEEIRESTVFSAKTIIDFRSIVNITTLFTYPMKIF